MHQSAILGHHGNICSSYVHMDDINDSSVDSHTIRHQGKLTGSMHIWDMILVTNT